jgi:hypothetical protein
VHAHVVALVRDGQAIAVTEATNASRRAAIFAGESSS